MKRNGETWLTAFYFVLYFAVVLTIALTQPLYDTEPYYQNPPDEHSRYLVPLYICNHGTIPTGFEEELISGSVRWTYGFYTLLPYIAQGYAMRVVKLCVTDDPLILLYTGRMVNVLCGAALAYVVLLIGRRLFADHRMRWLFCFLVTFLPQSIFMHTYVNPDSMCMLSTGLMTYGLLRGYGDAFSRRSCLILTAGIVLCALSYYNAYGFILSSIFLFAAYFIRYEDGKWSVAWRELLTKGAAVSALVLACISWQFIRNAVLYDGDIIGLETKENFIKSYGIVRETMQSRGEAWYTLFTERRFLKELIKNFIACYGSVSITGPDTLYRFYELVLGAGLAAAAIFRRGEPLTPFGRDGAHRMFFHVNMVFCIVMPFVLLVKYAYSVDYQAQGRYLMPGIIPLMFYVVYGLEKIPLWQRIPARAQSILTGVLLGGIVGSLLWMVYRRALPLYLQTEVLG